MLMRGKKGLGIGLLLAALIVSACGGLAGEPEVVATLQPRTDTNTQAPSQAAASDQVDQSVAISPVLATGAQIFADRCADCHGMTGAGDGPLVQSGQVESIPDFTDPASIAVRSPAQYFEVITNGNMQALMPPWRDALTEEQRWAVAYYSYLLAYDTDVFAQGQTLYNAAGGAGTLSGDSAGLNTDALLDDISGMAAFADLSAAEQAAVAAYARVMAADTFGATGAAVAQAEPADTGAGPIEEGAEMPDDAVHAGVGAGDTASDDTGAGPIEEGAEMPDDAVHAGVGAGDTASDDTAAVDAEIVTISGQVSNGTSGAALPDDMTVTLRVVDASFNEEAFEQTVGTDGTYTFEEVSLREDRGYVITTTYNDVLFASDMSFGTAEFADTSFDLTIYEPTTDASVIQTDSLVLQIDPAEIGVQIVQLSVFSNTSDRVYVGAEGTPGLQINLPQGATYLESANNTRRLVLADDMRSVYDMQPVLPETQHATHVAYMLVANDLQNVALPVDYPLDGNVEVYAGANHFSIESDLLSPEGTQETSSATYNAYIVEQVQLGSGETVNFDLQMQMPAAPIAAATAPAGSDNTPFLAFALMIAGAGTLTLAGVLWVRSGRSQASIGPDTPTDTPTNSDAKARINELVQQIADLDTRYEQRQIKKTKYERQRADLKDELSDLMKGTAG